MNCSRILIALLLLILPAISQAQLVNEHLKSSVAPKSLVTASDASQRNATGSGITENLNISATVTPIFPSAVDLIPLDAELQCDSESKSVSGQMSITNIMVDLDKKQCIVSMIGAGSIAFKCSSDAGQTLLNMLRTAQQLYWQRPASPPSFTFDGIACKHKTSNTLYYRNIKTINVYGLPIGS